MPTSSQDAEIVPGMIGTSTYYTQLTTPIHLLYRFTVEDQGNHEHKYIHTKSQGPDEALKTS